MLYMSNLIEYRGYHAKIEYSNEDDVLVGRILGINDTIVFDGESLSEIKDVFHESVDDYLEMCAEIGKEPDKEYKGTFNVRISPELHRKAALESETRGISLNQLVSESIQNEINCRHNREKETVTFVIPADALKEYSPLRGASYGCTDFKGQEAFVRWEETGAESLNFVS